MEKAVTIMRIYGFGKKDAIKKAILDTVCISQGTLSKMENDSILRKKVFSAIKEFCIPEERAKVDALQPPVKSEGLVVYPDGDVLYWLEGYSNGDDNDKKEQKFVTESRSNILID